MKSIDKRNSFKRPYKKYSFVNKNEDGKSHIHNVTCHCCGKLGHTTPHCHIRRVNVPKGLMIWVPKTVICLKKPKVSTSVEVQRGLRSQNHENKEGQKKEIREIKKQQRPKKKLKSPTGL